MTDTAPRVEPNSNLPTPARLRLIGPGAALGRVSAPFGASFSDGDCGLAVSLGALAAHDVETIGRVLPDPETLPEGTLVVVLPEVNDVPSLRSRVLKIFGRKRIVSRALRASALVARGYVRVAAGRERTTHRDLVWGYSS